MTSSRDALKSSTFSSTPKLQSLKNFRKPGWHAERVNDAFGRPGDRVSLLRETFNHGSKTLDLGTNVVLEDTEQLGILFNLPDWIDQKIGRQPVLPSQRVVGRGGFGTRNIARSRITVGFQEGGVAALENRQKAACTTRSANGFSDLDFRQRISGVDRRCRDRRHPIRVDVVGSTGR